MKKYSPFILTVVLSCAISFGLFKLFGENDPIIIEKPSEISSRMTRFGEESAAHPDFSETAALVTPAVVHIRSTMGASARNQQLPQSFRDFFGEDMFRDAPADKRGQQASGSGVIISEDGYIVTNNHVIEDAQEIEVSLYDKRTFKAKVVGTDPNTDLALIRVEEKGLPTLKFGNSDEVKVGQWVLAVGNPFNLESTVTAGIVSAKGRNINIFRENYAVESFIQTDAAVNPGNSGGALVNMRGDLIGINTAIASNTGSYAGYSFAVPTGIVSKVVEDLIKFGKVQRGFLGISIRGVDGNLAKEKGLNVNEGVYVESVQDEGAAKAAGVRAGDVIIKIDDKAVKSVPELQEQVARRRPGDKVSLIIKRKDEQVKIDVPLKDLKGRTELTQAAKTETFNSLGADFETADRKDCDKLGIEGGVKINKLFAGKLRSQTQIREGFVITKVNQRVVRNIEEFEKALQAESGGILLEGMYLDMPGKYYYGFGM
jgi:serine protease Do